MNINHVICYSHWHTGIKSSWEKKLKNLGHLQVYVNLKEDKY